MQSCTSYRIDPSNGFSVSSWSAFTSAYIDESKNKVAIVTHTKVIISWSNFWASYVSVTISAVFSFKSFYKSLLTALRSWNMMFQLSREKKNAKRQTIEQYLLLSGLRTFQWHHEFRDCNYRGGNIPILSPFCCHQLTYVGVSLSSRSLRKRGWQRSPTRIRNVVCSSTSRWTIP